MFRPHNKFKICHSYLHSGTQKASARLAGNMKTVGIIGGIGPESTIDYYRKIVAAYCDYDANSNYPQIIINSINMSEMLKRFGEDKLDEIADNLVVEFGKLAAAGADFGILAYSI